MYDNIPHQPYSSPACFLLDPILCIRFDFGDNNAVVISSDPSVTVQHSFELEEEIFMTRGAPFGRPEQGAYRPFVVRSVSSCD